MKELNKFTLSPQFYAPVKEKFKGLLEAYFEDQLENVGKLKTRLTSLETKLDKLESKYLFDEIPQALYEKHRVKLDIEKEQIQKEIDRTGKQISNFDEMAEKSVQYASKMSLLWENGDYSERQKVQKLVFPEGIFYNRENDQYLTPRVNSVSHRSKANKAAFGAKKDRTRSNFNTLVRVGSATRNRT